jgi:hypothetical protein
MKDPDQAADRKRELLSLIEFDKLNEKTLDECNDSEFIPPKYVAEAALNLCAKLRKELDEHKLLARENGINHHKPTRHVAFNTNKYNYDSNNNNHNNNSSNFYTSPTVTATARVTTTCVPSPLPASTSSYTPSSKYSCKSIAKSRRLFKRTLLDFSYKSYLIDC